MTISRDDLLATVFVALAVTVFFATHEGWGVPLVGDSHRWAAGAIGVLGIAACTRGKPADGVPTTVLAILGVVAAVLFAAALWTASLTPLSLLAADVVVLWVLATARHIGSDVHSLRHVH
jgi:hypothetical protein